MVNTCSHRYQGIDWRNKQSWGCNGAKGPAGNYHFDGIEMDPYEVHGVVGSGVCNSGVCVARKGWKGRQV
jgi:hypothetical protein